MACFRFADPSANRSVLRFADGRSERIRTSGPCLPKTVLYQAELHSGRLRGASYNLNIVGSQRDFAPAKSRKANGRDLSESLGEIARSPCRSNNLRPALSGVTRYTKRPPSLHLVAVAVEPETNPAGVSSGAALDVAARPEMEGKTVVAIICLTRGADKGAGVTLIRGPWVEYSHYILMWSILVKWMVSSPVLL